MVSKDEKGGDPFRQVRCRDRQLLLVCGLSKAKAELDFDPKDPMDTLLDTVHALEAKQDDLVGSQKPKQIGLFRRLSDEKAELSSRIVDNEQ